VHVLPKCDHVIVIQDGRILAQGSYDSIIEQGLDIEALIPKKHDQG